MTSEEIRSRFLAFFEKRGHAVIPSAPLVPLNDPSVLFNTAGMQPLVPYLLGEPHPKGTKLVNIQKCVRVQDIDEVGDKTHDTFFEMMGNWSLGDYFKEDAIKWSFEFLTSKEEGLGLDPARLYVTVFEGDENSPRDEEAFAIWKRFLPESRIYFMGAKSNWWSVGDNGPCGPDTEMFYDITPEGLGDLTKEEYIAADEAQKVVEIWNDVFMAYEKKDGKVVSELPKKNVDTGAGLERVVMAVQKKDSLFETDLFAPVMNAIASEAKSYDEKSARIFADHIRTSLFMIAAGVLPSNKSQGYVLRRLLRRAIMRSRKLGLHDAFVSVAANAFTDIYRTAYVELADPNLVTVITEEQSKFVKTLEQGLKEFERGEDPFVLATTYGFPIELTLELAAEKGIKIDLEDFNQKMTEHQKLSQTSSAGMFKGGLANHNEKTIRLHTAHHLLLAALQEVLGKEVKQRGSNITEERLRIDFAFDRKMNDEEKKRVEDIVNQRIADGLTVVRREMPRAEAEKLGAEMEFGVKYPDTVSVYFIEDGEGNAVSKEFCGGPHVSNTAELAANPGGTPKHFKIQKEEASSQGVRRIKAVLE